MGKIALLLLLSSLARADRVPGAIVHFQFPREECLEGSFRDSASPPLFGDLSVDASDEVRLLVSAVAFAPAARLSFAVGVRHASALRRAQNMTDGRWHQLLNDTGTFCAVPARRRYKLYGRSRSESSQRE